jgi:hypothetical protein
MNGAVAEADDEQPLTVDRRDERRSVGGVVGTRARTGDVDDLTRALVERDQPVRPR